MENFRFENRTRIQFGDNVHLLSGHYCGQYSENLLILFGSNRIKDNGILDSVINSQKEQGISCKLLGGANATISYVYEGIDFCRKNSIRFILAIGGGSVIDTAKAIALGIEFDGDVLDFFLGKAKLERDCPIKIGAIPTIAGSASEVSASSVIDFEMDGKVWKRDYTHNSLRPEFALVNPLFTLTVDHKLTMCGCVDAFSHIMERYFTRVTNVKFSDSLCEATARTILANMLELNENLLDYNTRSEFFWASIIAHNNILSAGRYSDWACHKIEHELSAMYSIKHGEGLAIILPAWMKYVETKYPDKVHQFEKNVCSLEVLLGYFQKCSIPSKLSEISIGNNNFEMLADQVLSLRGESVGEYVALSKNDIIEILKLAL